MQVLVLPIGFSGLQLAPVHSVSEELLVELRMKVPLVLVDSP